MSAILRELRVARSFSACLSDEAALDEAQAEYRALIDALRCALNTLVAIHPPLHGLPDHPTLVVIRAAITKATGDA